MAKSGTTLYLKKNRLRNCGKEGTRKIQICTQSHRTSDCCWESNYVHKSRGSESPNLRRPPPHPGPTRCGPHEGLWVPLKGAATPSAPGRPHRPAGDNTGDADGRKWGSDQTISCAPAPLHDVQIHLNLLETQVPPPGDFPLFPGPGIAQLGCRGCLPIHKAPEFPRPCPKLRPWCLHSEIGLRLETKMRNTRQNKFQFTDTGFQEDTPRC